jgi:hypothetical protein
VNSTAATPSLSDLLTGDRRRAHEKLEEQATILRREARTTLTTVAERALTSKGDAEEAAKAAIAAAIPEFFEPKLAEISRSFSTEVEEFSATMCKAAKRWLA